MGGDIRNRFFERILILHRRPIPGVGMAIAIDFQILQGHMHIIFQRHPRPGFLIIDHGNDTRMISIRPIGQAEEMERHRENLRILIMHLIVAAGPIILPGVKALLETGNLTHEIRINRLGRRISFHSHRRIGDIPIRLLLIHRTDRC